MAAPGQSQIGVHVAARGPGGAQDTGLGGPIAIVTGCDVRWEVGGGQLLASVTEMGAELRPRSHHEAAG